MNLRMNTIFFFSSVVQMIVNYLKMNFTERSDIVHPYRTGQRFSQSGAFYSVDISF